jgi:hypothetical protein
MQAEHLCMVRSICDALVAAGFDTLDKQTEVLGLPRSTTWTMLRGKHKKSGISATLLTRMLKSHRLPHAVRAKIIEYIQAKAAGGCGHNKLQQRRFVARLKREGSSIVQFVSPTFPTQAKNPGISRGPPQKSS